jgi:two-component system, NtrC family, response regulator AtoC
VVVRVGTIDRGVLHQLDAQLTDARRERGAVLVVRGAPPAALPVGATVLVQTDERWLVTLACERTQVGELAKTIDPAAGVAVFPEHGGDAGELYLAAERDRMRRRDGASAMDPVYALAERVAGSAASVLIQGETGVGKELLAELIHRRSPRADAPLVKVNCAAFAPSLFESQMFGHERGAFTGADVAATGLIEAADGGTLFLDEIAELPLELQAKLLRVLEDRVVVRVGAVAGKCVDVRFVCATSEPLVRRVETGQFRADLYYRLTAVTLEIPPLRERSEEIQPLAELFALRIAETTRRAAPAFAAAALDKLRGFGWPGNIRQLRNAIERAVMLCDGPVIAPEHIWLDAPAARPTPPPSPPPVEVPAQLDSHNPEHVMQALAVCAGNQTRAARMLGISRNTLLARLDGLGLPRPRKKS